MRSPLVPLATGALTVVLVASAVLVWALFLRAPESTPVSEVVIGTSPEGASPDPTDEDVVTPPPAVTGEEDPVESAPPSEPAETEPPSSPTGFPVDCLDGASGHESWGEDQWDDWWDACLEARFEDDDDD
ncbi:hypothetical protein ACFW3Z_15910 [Nocardiopsis alba]|uniref:hypothetical protein n=1 Tax=Nocardiopsis alba TaxID=53437 RepID=UPI0033BE85DE